MTQVFISYSRRDLTFVERLVKDFRAAGLEVWYDLSGLEPGERWGKEIQAAIRVSKFFLVVLSPYSVESEWVEREFIYASGQKIKVVPILLRECELPMWILNRHIIDLSGRKYSQNLPQLLKTLGVAPAVSPLPAAAPRLQKPRPDAEPLAETEATSGHADNRAGVLSGPLSWRTAMLFVLLWSAVGLAAGLVGSPILGVMLPLIEKASTNYESYMIMGSVTSSVVVNSIGGLGEWLLLRMRIRRAGWWIPVSGLGWGVVAGVYSFLKVHLDYGLSAMDQFLIFLAGLLLGGGGWLVLRGQVRRTGWWVLFCGLGAWLIFVVDPPWYLQYPPYGVISGALMAWLLAHPRSPG